MKNLGKSIVVLVSLLSLAGLIGCEQDEQTVDKAKEIIGVTESADKSEDESKKEEAESTESEVSGESEKK